MSYSMLIICYNNIWFKYNCGRAAKNGHKYIVGLLIEKGANDINNIVLHTALHELILNPYREYLKENKK